MLALQYFRTESRLENQIFFPVQVMSVHMHTPPSLKMCNTQKQASSPGEGSHLVIGTYSAQSAIPATSL